MKLYHFEGCPFCARVRFVLAEKGISYESILVDPENPPHEFPALSPDGMVPVWVEGQTTLLESNVIDEYLEERFPSKPLLPKDLGARARVRMAIAQFDDLKSTLWEDTPEAQENLRDGLARLSESLGDQAYLFGELTLADIAIAPFLPYLKGMASVQTPTNILAWNERLKNRPAFVKDPYYANVGHDE